VGKDLPNAIGVWYLTHGYAFLGISDMNTYTWASEYGTGGNPAIPTVDATYPFAEVLAVGMDHWRPANDLQGAIDWIAHDGGLPVQPGSSGPDPMSDQLLSAGNRVYAFAGDDATSLQDPALGRAWIEVLALTPAVNSLLSSLRQGAFFASTGADFTRLSLTGTTITVEGAPGSSLHFIGRDGQVLKAVAASTGSYQVRGDEGYARVEAIGESISWR